MQQLSEQVQTLLEPVVTALGYELFGVEYRPRGDGSVLRLYIDRPEGISIDDCQRVSHQVSGVLDVEDPLPGEYLLEVSSPGMDRPLLAAEHYQRFAGQTVSIRLCAPLDGRRKLIGLLRGLRGDAVVVEVDGGERLIPLAQVEKARLVPDFQGGER